ncbi:bestrophin family protein [Halocola ammonii]
MQAGKRYTFFQTSNWSKKYIFTFLVFDTAVVATFALANLEWLNLPWQPISLIGIAVAFYLGFKNNSSYERMWEARKIWGGIVNTSRSITVMAREYINGENSTSKPSDEELKKTVREFVDRHIAWLQSLALELRKVQGWEHTDKGHQKLREKFGTDYSEEKFQNLKKYLSEEEFNYILKKGNRSSHLLSLQTKHLMALRSAGTLEHFRHLQMQDQITELYTLQGKSERIKNFPFPRQYATVTYFFVVLFIILLPFGMINIFKDLPGYWIWVAIPFSVICSWVFWMMEMIGSTSENPFEGLYNDVPISSMATSIEIDILQMLDEDELPESIQPVGNMKLLF